MQSSTSPTTGDVMPTTTPMEGMPGSEGDDGASVELNRGATHIQWRPMGAPAWIDLVALEDITGDDGVSPQSVELNKGTTHIQWRLVGSPTWINLVALADLKGDAGINGVDAKRVVVASGTTNGSGDVSFTFTPAFASAPHIDATILPQSNVNHKCRVTANSTTGCTVRVESQNQAFLSLLGIDVLSAAVTAVSGATVSITATER